MGGILKAASAALGTTPIGLGLAGLSAAGSIFGAIKSAQANKANERMLNQQAEENKAEYDNTANRSFLDTNAAKDAVRLQNENLVDNRKAVAGRAAITGASDEANVAANTGVQRSYNDSISRIAALGTDYQDRARNMYRAERRNIYGQRMNLNSQKSESAANLAGNAGDLFSTMTFNSGLNSLNKTQGNTTTPPITTEDYGYEANVGNKSTYNYADPNAPSQDFRSRQGN